MKPILYVENSPLAAPGIAHAVHQPSAGAFVRFSGRQKTSNQESGRPYPGVSVCSARELLDFGFENAEILQGRDD
jgi:hypothetical protein